MTLNDGKPYTPEERREFYHNLPALQKLDLDMEGRPTFVWQQYPGEPRWAFEYFTEYLSQGRYRTTEVVAEFKQVSLKAVRHASKKYMWVERAKAWDAHQRDLFLQRREEDIQELNDKSLDLSRKVIEKLATRMESLDPDEIAVRNIAPMMKEAVNIGRLALGMSTENVEEKQEQRISIEYIADWRNPNGLPQANDGQDVIEGEAQVLELEGGDIEDE